MCMTVASTSSVPCSTLQAITELLALSRSFVWLCLWYDIPSQCPWAVMTPCWDCKACARAWGALPGWLIASVMKQHTGPERYWGSSVCVRTRVCISQYYTPSRSVVTTVAGASLVRVKDNAYWPGVRQWTCWGSARSCTCTVTTTSHAALQREGPITQHFKTLEVWHTHTVLRTGLQDFAGDPGPAALAPPAWAQPAVKWGARRNLLVMRSGISFSLTSGKSFL